MLFSPIVSSLPFGVIINVVSSNSDLSMEINLSASACHRRVSRLESNKVVKNYVALLDPIKVNLSTTVFVEITLNGQADEVLNKFEKERPKKYKTIILNNK